MTQKILIPITQEAQRFVARYGSHFIHIGNMGDGSISIQSVKTMERIEVRNDVDNKDENKAGIYVNGELWSRNW